MPNSARLGKKAGMKLVKHQHCCSQLFDPSSPFHLLLCPCQNAHADKLNTDGRVSLMSRTALSNGIIPKYTYLPQTTRVLLLPCQTLLQASTEDAAGS